MMKDKGGGENAVEKLDGVDPLDDLALGLGFKGDDQFARVHAAMDLGSLDQANALDDRWNPIGMTVDDEA